MSNNLIQYFYYKKTGEVVFDKSIVNRKNLKDTSGYTRNNKLVEVLYGTNIGKTLIVNVVQLTLIKPTSVLNTWEKLQLRTSHLSKNESRLKDTIYYIKKVRDNNYPPFWDQYLNEEFGSTILYNIDYKSDKESNKNIQNENSSETSSSDSIDSKNNDPDYVDKNNNVNNLKIITFSNPNLILPNLLNTLNQQLQPYVLKDNDNSNNNNNSNEIRFEFQEQGGVFIQVVDFITRIRWNLLLNQNDNYNLALGSCIYFDKPFEKELLISKELNYNKKQLLEQCIIWTKEQIDIYNNNSIKNKLDIRNFGIEKIDISNEIGNKIVKHNETKTNKYDKYKKYYIIRYLYE